MLQYGTYKLSIELDSNKISASKAIFLFKIAFKMWKTSIKYL